MSTSGPWSGSTAVTASRRAPAHGLSPRGVLAVHGHPPRPPAPGGPLDLGEGAVESLGVVTLRAGGNPAVPCHRIVDSIGHPPGPPVPPRRVDGFTHERI